MPTSYILSAVNVFLDDHLTYEDSFLVYLPLALALEYIAKLVMIFFGMPAVSDASRPLQMTERWHL